MSQSSIGHGEIRSPIGIHYLTCKARAFSSGMKKQCDCKYRKMDIVFLGIVTTLPNNILAYLLTYNVVLLVLSVMIPTK
jgi:hypothetical protein